MDGNIFIDHNCNDSKKQLFVKNGYQIFECTICLHRFVEVSDHKNHITNVYSDSYFFDGKSGYPNYLDEKAVLISAGKRYAKLISKYTIPGNLLDVGCAAGFIMKGFEEEGWHCDGIEPNDTMASYGRSEMRLNIHTGSFEEYTTNKKYDLISLIEVIGHFHDLDKALKNISGMLNVGGFVLVESWNMNSAVAKLLGSNWYEYSPPSVLHWFSDFALSQQFNNGGFQLIAKGHPQKRINVKHALSILDERLPRFIFKKELIKRANLLAGKFTLIYPLHDLKWYLFKKTDTSF